MERLVYKALKLITPEEADRLGFDTETPLFVSSSIKDQHRCADCQNSFTPLAYRVGSRIESQHFHSRSGGIYGYPNLMEAMNYETVGYWGTTAFTGFIALAKSIGHHVTEQTSFADVSFIRSQAVDVIGMKAFVEGIEIEKGRVQEMTDKTGTYLKIFSERMSLRAGDEGRFRYSFRIEPRSEVTFYSPRAGLLVPEVFQAISL